MTKIKGCGFLVGIAVLAITLPLLVACRQTPTVAPATRSAPLSQETTPALTAALQPTAVADAAPERTPTQAPERSPTPSPLPVAPPPRGIPHHTLELKLNYPDRRVDVAHQVLLVNRTSDNWDEIVFSVPPAHGSGVFLLDEAQVRTTGGWIRSSFALNGTMLHVDLPAVLPPGAAMKVNLRYTMRAPEIELTTWLPEGNFGAGERVLQAGDWHPTVVPYRDGAGWQVWRYYPVGDLTVYPVADYDVTIATDPAIVIAAPGQVDDGGDVRRYRLERARSFAFLASPDYRVMDGTVQGLTVRSYYLPSNAEPAEAAMETALRAIELYSEYYGPYPYPDLGLTIAQNAYYGAMEYSGLVSLSGYMYQRYAEPVRPSLSFLTAHEIAHQWWYGAVGNDQVNEPWLDESFAKYSELLFAERYEPELTQWWWETNVYRFDPDGDLDRTIYDFATTQAYIRQIYGLGARFLNDLRTTLGDEAFFDFVRAYRQYGEGDLVTGEDFFAVLRTSTDVDLDPLVGRYFSQTGD
ncbi:MAG: M1 family metallopeptidase [Anaerolineae bacterium]